MGENTRIQWAHHTFNPWRGCTKVAPGCANCYAEAQSKRNPKTLGIWGPNGTRVVASEAMWREPVKWNKAAAKAKHDHGELLTEKDLAAGPVFRRDRVFCASLADVFEDWSGFLRDAHGLPQYRTRPEPGEPEWWEPIASLYIGKSVIRLDDVRARLFRLIDSTPNLDWLLLTKRPENIRRMVHDSWTEKAPGHVSQNDGDGRRWKRRDNVWLGTSIACQEDADRNIPELLKCRDLAAKLFVSIEPLVGPVDLTRLDNGGGERYDALRGEVRTVGGNKFRASDRDPIDWVIVGGESGPNARPCDVAWIRSIVQQCQSVGVPVFVKQLGERCVIESAGGDVANTAYRASGWVSQTGTAYHAGWFRGADRKGGDPAEWPEDLRVREVPA